MNKAATLRRAVLKEGLTLAGSIGVGDTESDIPFLELVEQPICFNPNAKLYAHAKRRNGRSWWSEKIWCIKSADKHESKQRMNTNPRFFILPL